MITGDSRVDRISGEGLYSLSETLARRTSFVPSEPQGIDPARDELSFYPLIYWPIAPDRPQPGPEVARRIEAYMKQGGLVLFDTRDAGMQFEGGPATPAQAWLKTFLKDIDLPPLEPTPRDHVVTKTFYLLENFVGRTENGATYIEALPPDTEKEGRPARAGDGVSPIIIASNDLAAAWAGDQGGDGALSARPGRPAPARNGAARRGQYRDVHADRQLQGRSGPCAGIAGKARALREFSLAFAPLAPLWLIGLFAVVAAALVVAALVLRRRGAVLRAVVFTALLGALANPSLVEERREPLRDVVAVVLDRSASQDFGDRRAQTEAARVALDKALKGLDNVEVRTIDAGADAGESEGGDGTRLFSALNAGLADVAGERLGARHHGDGRPWSTTSRRRSPPRASRRRSMP